MSSLCIVFDLHILLIWITGLVVTYIQLNQFSCDVSILDRGFFQKPITSTMSSRNMRGLNDIKDIFKRVTSIRAFSMGRQAVKNEVREEDDSSTRCLSPSATNVFDIIQAAHIATGHGGRDRLLKETSIKRGTKIPGVLNMLHQESLSNKEHLLDL
ncbi:unnamed protein product [Trichogramma brassicae]|uniref:Uncharacterized protein n=1 Tax=Trichogramma brassicae TaxID=86971 RepID=A0A6H5I5U7_9HYME|nr:unnamed protein product [Trichogramma brassicae]